VVCEGSLLDIEVVLDVAVSDTEATFRISLVNRSPFIVEEVIAPCLAGIKRPTDFDAWRLIGPRTISGAFEYRVFDVVPSSYHGPRKSNVLHPYPGGWTNEMSLGMPWVALEHSSGAGLYVGNHDEDITFSCFMTEFDAELRLDAEDQIAFGNSAPQRWPSEPEDGTLALAWAHFPFVAPQESFRGPDIVVRSLKEAGWRAAVDYFRVEREQRLEVTPSRRTWLADADVWAFVCMMFNDGTVLKRVSDLPHLAAQASAAGIGTLVLLGWSEGGLDAGFPFYRLDSRLGTPAEFSAALEECRGSGVHALVLAQIQQICAETAWFREEGHRYLVQNPSGDPYYYGGVHYAPNTLLMQLGFEAPQILTANPAHPEFRKLILAELERIVDYGVDGVLLDKVNCGDPYSLDFNPSLAGTPSTRFHRALEETVREFIARLDRHPNFAVVTESGWDRVMPYCEAALTRYFEREHLPVQELAYPDVRVTTTVVADSDTNTVNNALRYGHVICLEPHYSHDDLTSLPNLTRYIREVSKLRRHLRGLLWDGTIADPTCVEVVGDDVLYGVFTPTTVSSSNGQLAVVLNHFQDAPRAATIACPNKPGAAIVYRPFREPERVDVPLELVVPPGEYVVLVAGAV
jgi:hypothetical protein